MPPRDNISYIVVRIQKWPDAKVNVSKITSMVQVAVVAALGSDGRCVSVGTSTLHGIERRMDTYEKLQ